MRITLQSDRFYEPGGSCYASLRLAMTSTRIPVVFLKADILCLGLPILKSTPLHIIPANNNNSSKPPLPLYVATHE